MLLQCIHFREMLWKFHELNWISNCSSSTQLKTFKWTYQFKSWMPHTNFVVTTTKKLFWNSFGVTYFRPSSVDHRTKSKPWLRQQRQPASSPDKGSGLFGLLRRHQTGFRGLQGRWQGPSAITLSPTTPPWKTAAARCCTNRSLGFLAANGGAKGRLRPLLPGTPTKSGRGRRRRLLWKSKPEQRRFLGNNCKF